MSKRYGSLEERFWNEVVPEPMSGCWIWTGPTDDFGYGRFRDGSGKVRAHRLSWELHGRSVPTGMVLRHRCDVACCVNPGHLEVGTVRENISDMDARGRRSEGENHPGAKLTLEQVLAIRADIRPQRVIAAAYGLASHTSVGRIQRGEKWRRAQ